MTGAYVRLSSEDGLVSFGSSDLLVRTANGVVRRNVDEVPRPQLQQAAHKLKDWSKGESFTNLLSVDRGTECRKVAADNS